MESVRFKLVADGGGVAERRIVSLMGAALLDFDSSDGGCEVKRRNWYVVSASSSSLCGSLGSRLCSGICERRGSPD